MEILSANTKENPFFYNFSAFSTLEKKLFLESLSKANPMVASFNNSGLVVASAVEEDSTFTSLSSSPANSTLVKVYSSAFYKVILP